MDVGVIQQAGVDLSRAYVVRSVDRQYIFFFKIADQMSYINSVIIISHYCISGLIVPNMFSISKCRIM